MPGKKAMLSFAIMFAVGILVYNKVPAVRKALGAAA